MIDNTSTTWSDHCTIASLHGAVSMRRIHCCRWRNIELFRTSADESSRPNNIRRNNWLTSAICCRSMNDTLVHESHIACKWRCIGWFGHSHTLDDDKRMHTLSDRAPHRMDRRARLSVELRRDAARRSRYCNDGKLIHRDIGSHCGLSWRARSDLLVRNSRCDTMHHSSCEWLDNENAGVRRSSVNLCNSPRDPCSTSGTVSLPRCRHHRREMIHNGRDVSRTHREPNEKAVGLTGALVAQAAGHRTMCFLSLWLWHVRSRWSLAFFDWRNVDTADFSIENRSLIVEKVSLDRKWSKSFAYRGPVAWHACNRWWSIAAMDYPISCATDWRRDDRKWSDPLSRLAMTASNRDVLTGIQSMLRNGTVACRCRERLSGDTSNSTNSRHGQRTSESTSMLDSLQ